LAISGSGGRRRQFPVVLFLIGSRHHPPAVTLRRTARSEASRNVSSGCQRPASIFGIPAFKKPVGSFFSELTKVSLPLVYQSKENTQEMISKVNLTDEQKQLLERLAVLYEQGGVPPAPAKILALLTVSDVTELSFDQIQDTLEISKSATSQALTQLQTFKQVEYASRIGDRKRYFKLRTNNWLESIIEKFEHLRLTSEVYCEILKQRPADTKDFNKALEIKAKLLRFAVDNLPGMLKDLDCGAGES